MQPVPEAPETSREMQDSELEQYAAHTRRSLILKLGDWQDRRSWDEFYRTYWRLIYAVAKKALLRDDEAWDVVQETILTIAKQSRRQAYDPERGSFKNWLLQITRWRINDRFRERQKNLSVQEEQEPPCPETIADSEANFEQLWEREWQENLMKAALERVKTRVTPQQYQIFDYATLRGMPAGEVRRKLGVSMAQVYLARHRVGNALKKEVVYLRSQENDPSLLQ